MKKMIIASTSTVYGQEYLAYLLPTLEKFFEQINQITFIPYARPGGITHEEYTEKVASAFAKINIRVKGLHEYATAKEGIEQVEALFTGGGNTFLLVQQLYGNDIMQLLKQKIEAGTPYLGTSAGSNITGLTMNTTNDMPIVYPPSFQTLGCVPFNINPHYLDPLPNSQHMGETRETRIAEFHHFNTQPVVGLREGSWLEVSGKDIWLRGNLPARIFQQNKVPFEQETDSLLNEIY
ncbi:MAG TPA: dipeptidase PepE [Flavobacterium sp.]|nr:dipeptidase PepE [Flavobacterium sp.]